VTHSIWISGRDRKAKNFATPLYSGAFLPPMTHTDAPPMIEFCGAPLTSSWYGMKLIDKSNFAALRMPACAPVLPLNMAHSPLENLASPWLVRPAEVNRPFFDMSESIETWRTCSGDLMLNWVSTPPMPCCLVP